MESTESYYRMDGQSHIHWLLSAFLSFALFGTGNFIITDDSQKDPRELKLIISIAYLICMITLGICHMIQLCIRDGTCPSLYPSSIYTKENGLISGFTIGIIGGIFLFLGQFFLLLAMDVEANKSATFFCLAGISPISSVLSFIVYKEKLSVLQIVGMTITVAGIIVLVAWNLEEDIYSYFYGVGILLAFSFRNFIGRVMEGKGISIYTGVMLISVGEILSAVVFLAVWLANYEFNLKSIIDLCNSQFLIGSLIIASSLYFVSHTIATGNIGVVTTIINSNGVVYMLLAYFFSEDDINLSEIIGSALIVFGLAILLTGDILNTRLFSKPKKNASGITTIF